MRGQKVYAVMGLITILTIGELLLNIYPTSAYKHPPICPPFCFMTYGEVESVQQTSAPLGPGAPAIAVSDQGASKELGGASKRYAYVYADADKKTKVKVSIGHEVYEMFKVSPKLVGFSVMADRKHRDKEKDTNKEAVPELIAFVPFEYSKIMPPSKPPTAAEALKAYMDAFKKCAQTNTCGGEESAAQH